MEQEKAKNVQELQNRQEFTAYIMWQVWRARNAWCFKGETWAEKEIVERACEEWKEFKQ